MPGTPPPLPPAATGTHWEYKIVVLPSWEPEIAEEELNQLGLEHWELVGVSRSFWGKERLIFKRKYILRGNSRL